MGPIAGESCRHRARREANGFARILKYIVWPRNGDGERIRHPASRRVGEVAVGKIEGGRRDASFERFRGGEVARYHRYSCTPFAATRQPALSRTKNLLALRRKQAGAPV